MPQKNSIKLQHWLIDLRRAFHRIPELSFKEIKTADLICKTLDQLKAPYDRNIGCTGIVASLKSKHQGPCIAFRSDMDALPLTETTKLSYQSQHPGAMHACGHDGHMTIALGIIRQLQESQWQRTGKGQILFIFQPAEENGAGARIMLETGYFNNYPISAVFAGHLNPRLPTGTVELLEGAAHAASDTLEIEITGEGGHGAAPHLCQDPIVAAAYLITGLQSLVARTMNPLDSAVLTIGRIRAGTTDNIIPAEAHLTGTLRTLSEDVRTLLIRGLKDMLAALEKSHRVKTHLKVHDGYPVAVNDSALTAYMTKKAAQILGPQHVQMGKPSMGAEDFAYFCRQWPGVMTVIGCHDPAKGYQYGLHSPQFQMDEDALMVAVKLFSQTLATYSDDIE